MRSPSGVLAILCLGARLSLDTTGDLPGRALDATGQIYSIDVIVYTFDHSSACSQAEGKPAQDNPRVRDPPLRIRNRARVYQRNKFPQPV